MEVKTTTDLLMQMPLTEKHFDKLYNLIKINAMIAAKSYGVGEDEAYSVIKSECLINGMTNECFAQTISMMQSVCKDKNERPDTFIRCVRKSILYAGIYLSNVKGVSDDYVLQQTAG